MAVCIPSTTPAPSFTPSPLERAVCLSTITCRVKFFLFWLGYFAACKGIEYYNNDWEVKNATEYCQPLKQNVDHICGLWCHFNMSEVGEARDVIVHRSICLCVVVLVMMMMMMMRFQKWSHFAHNCSHKIPSEIRSCRECSRLVWYIRHVPLTVSHSCLLTVSVFVS